MVILHSSLLILHFFRSVNAKQLERLALQAGLVAVRQHSVRVRPRTPSSEEFGVQSEKLLGIALRGVD